MEAYDSLAEVYDTMHTDPVSRAEDRIVRDELRRLEEGNPTVIDLGCGTGKLHELMTVGPSRYMGLDASPRMIREARRKYPHYRFEEADLDAQTYGLHAFDLGISLFGALSYVRRPTEVLGKLRRSLARGGRAYLMVYGLRYPQRYTYVLRDVAVHRNLWTKADLRHNLETAGFSDIRIRGLTLGDYRGLVDPSPMYDEETQEKMAYALLNLERSSIGKLFADRFYWLIAEASA